MKIILILISVYFLVYGFDIKENNEFIRINPDGKNINQIISFNTCLDKAISSVVSIFITAKHINKPISAGSGVIISKNGYIITNAHVVKKAKNIYIYLKNSKRKKLAKIIGIDKASDIAILKISGKNYNSIKFFNSNLVKITDLVFTIGNGFGLGTTVSMGIVSAINKRSLNIYEYENLIQTDATINPGNSGGALVNNCGELIGINSAIYTKSGGSNGVGFAIPSNTVKIIASEIIEHGNFVRGYFGASFDLKNEDEVFIDGIDKLSPAYKIGLRKKDIILSLNGSKIDEIGDIIYLLGLQSPNKIINVTYIRNGVKNNCKIKLSKRPK